MGTAATKIDSKAYPAAKSPDLVTVDSAAANKPSTEFERLQNLAQAVDAFFASIEFDQNGTVLSCNKNFLTTMGYQEGELNGQHHQIFCEQAEVNSRSYTEFWLNLRSGITQEGIFKRLSKNGEKKYLQAVYKPIQDENGRVTRVIKIASDITKEQLVINEAEEAANALASTAEELTATATEMASAAANTTKESQEAAAATQQVASGVQTVATNIEEMVASIKEISRSTTESAHMAKQTLEKAHKSNDIVNKLGSSSQEIGAVIKVINSIAQQTNLLALNAQIEAARAGEAGKGFAVVANEVKELAKQTAKATDDITNRIGSIQSDTKGAVEAINEISQSVESLNSLTNIVAAAIEEQTATTNEISRVVLESKSGVDSIVSAIKAVSQVATTTSANSAQTAEATKGLSKLASDMADLVKKVK